MPLTQAITLSRSVDLPDIEGKNLSLGLRNDITSIIHDDIGHFLSIGPIFLGVLMPARLSITQMAMMPLIYGEQRLHSPALSVIRYLKPALCPHSTAASILLDKKVVGAKLARKAGFYSYATLFIAQMIE